MDFHDKKTLGRTGLKVGRLGISSSFGAPSVAYEEAFERGCNYFTWGTFIKGRSSEMKESIKNIIMKGERENLILAFFSYAHHSYLTEAFFIWGMKALGITYVDVWNRFIYRHPLGSIPQVKKNARRRNRATGCRLLSICIV
jgi:hypothetical protein